VPFYGLSFAVPPLFSDSAPFDLLIVFQKGNFFCAWDARRFPGRIALEIEPAPPDGEASEQLATLRATVQQRACRDGVGLIEHVRWLGLNQATRFTLGAK
jgi:hypothetical protein